MKKFYCLWVITGSEEDYVKDVQPLLDDPESPIQGKLYNLGKQMRLKNGKEYTAPLFPSYIFLETDQLNSKDLRLLQKGRGFIKILPNNKEIQSLSPDDTELILSIIKFGTVIPIVHATFDVNDKIVILDGPFKGKEGLVTAVNRRNKRVNFEVKLMNGIAVIGLTYEVMDRVDKESVNTD